MATRATKSPASTKPSGRLRWRRLLVPLDFSKASLRAFKVAVPLARDCGARLFLLSAIEPSGYAAGMEAVATVVPDSVLVEDARSNLPKLARQLVPSGIPVTCLVGRGKAFDVITRVATTRGIDLIVLTTHGRTGLERVLMGSTAELVVRHASCPVYVVRAFGPRPGRRRRKD